jgi:hypothetical protein
MRYATATNAEILARCITLRAFANERSLLRSFRLSLWQELKFAQSILVCNRRAKQRGEG